jgi:cyclase
VLSIPLTVGGGVRSIADFRALLRAGADRVAINSAAVRRPALIREAAAEFGVQAVVLACDVRGGADGEVVVSAGRSGTGLDPLQWCQTAVEAGAGEILLSSVDRDGTQLGFDTALLRRISSAVNAGVIASGGAGNARHFLQAIEEGGACAALAASLFHDRTLSIGQVKSYLSEAGMRVRGLDNER